MNSEYLGEHRDLGEHGVQHPVAHRVPLSTEMAEGVGKHVLLSPNPTPTDVPDRIRVLFRGELECDQKGRRVPRKVGNIVLPEANMVGDDGDETSVDYRSIKTSGITSHVLSIPNATNLHRLACSGVSRSRTQEATCYL